MEIKHHPDISLITVQRMNWLLLIGLAGAGWLIATWHVAISIVVGGIVANLSFYLLKGDLLRLFSGPLDAVKVRFFIKYYIRLAAVAVVLFFLVKSGKVHPIGLLFGLSTVFFSILLTITGMTKRFFFSVKEAL